MLETMYEFMINGEPGGETRTPGQNAETRVLQLLRPLQEQSGKAPDAYTISTALMDYQDRKREAAVGMTLTREPGKPLPKYKNTRTPNPQEEKVIDSILHVRDVFDILAFRDFPGNYQQTLSEEIYDADARVHRPEEEVTLTQEEKKILQTLTALTGVEDDPKQLTYSYGSIPKIVAAEH